MYNQVDNNNQLLVNASIINDRHISNDQYNND